MHEFVHLFLFGASSFEELDELSLGVVEAFGYRLSLSFYVTEGKDTLFDVARLHLFPDLDLVLACVSYTLVLTATADRGSDRLL